MNGTLKTENFKKPKKLNLVKKQLFGPINWWQDAKHL
jgi:hypothetical protein